MELPIPSFSAVDASEGVCGSPESVVAVLEEEGVHWPSDLDEYGYIVTSEVILLNNWRRPNVFPSPMRVDVGTRWLSFG